MRSAYVYVAANELLANLVKIGVAKEPVERMRGLTSTSFPGKFEVKYATQCDDAFRVERYVHAALAEWRIDRSREFFRVSIERAASAIATAIKGPTYLLPELSVLADALTQKRQALGLSQKEAAALIGVTQSCLSKIEGGAEGTSIGLILRHAQALGLRIDLV